MRPKLWPLLPPEHHDRNFAARKILLMADVLVGCQQ
jgi:hypothetical protein